MPLAKRYELAKQNIDRAIEIEKSIEGSPRLSVRYGIASEIYNKLERHEEALAFARQAYELDFKTNDTVKYAKRLSQMGDVYLAMGNDVQAEECYLRANSLLEHRQEPHSLAITYRQLGTIYLKRGNNKQAEKYLRQALSMTEADDEKYTLMQVYENLYLVYKDVDVRNALKYLELYSKTKDDIYSEESNRMFSEYEAKYETVQKELMLKESNLQLMKKEVDLSRLQTMRWWFIIGIAILLVAVVILYALIVVRSRSHTLQKMEQMRATFFTNVTHEFRTPLTIILGLTDRIFKQSTNDSIKSDCKTVKSQSEELLSLVNQMLDYTKITSDAGVAKWEHGDIRPLVEMIFEVQNSYAQAKGINFHHGISDKPIEMDFVSDYIQKIFRNLISNAIKFTGEGGDVFVSVKEENGIVIFRIADTGRGISEEDQKLIFEPFYQANNGEDSKMGTGIGLSLTRHIVLAMNGTISVTSKEGVGTVFNVLLPLKADSAPIQIDKTVIDSSLEEIEGNSLEELKQVLSTSENVKKTDLGKENNSIKILIAEDNPDLSEYICSIFAGRYTVIRAKDGVEALEKANECIPDLILTDLMMPRMDGNQLCRSVKQSELLSHIPVVIITAKESQEERLEGFQNGAIEYVVKPFNADELSMRIDNIINNNIAQQQTFKDSLERGENPASQLPVPEKEFIEKLTQLIFEQMEACDVTLDSIANRLCITNQQLRRKINAITGETGAAYILRIRLNRAQELLKSDADTTIDAIATQCGFDDNNYFSRTFKRVIGMSPSQYRNQ